MYLINKLKLFSVASACLLLTSCGMSPQSSGDAKAVDQTAVRALTFNTYLLNGTGTGTHSSQRIKLMPQAIADTEADFVFLQEVWEAKHKAFLTEEMKKLGYPFAAIYENPDGKTGWDTMGNGMMILSKHEFVSKVTFTPWSNWTRLLERKSSKGLMRVDAKLPSGTVVSLFTAHTSTKQFKNGEYKATHIQKRLVQIDQIKTLMAQAKAETNGAPQILGIDLNTHVYKWDKAQEGFSTELASEYTYLMEQAGLKDSDQDSDSAKRKTYHPAENYWGANGFFGDEPGQKLDYIFVSKDVVTAGSSEMVLEDTFSIEKDGSSFEAPLSDHYGILSSFFL